MALNLTNSSGNYESLLIAGAANTVAGCIAWLKSKPYSKNRNLQIVAYACANVVCIVTIAEGSFNLQGGHIIATLGGTLGVVERIKTLSTVLASNGVSYIISGSEKGTVNIWNSEDQLEWTLLQSISSSNKHAVSSVSCFEILNDKSSIIYFVTCDAFGQCIVYSNIIRDTDSQNGSKPTFKVHQIINFPPQQTPTVSHFINLRSQASLTLVLCIGCVDSKIHMYSLNQELLFEPDKSEKQYFKSIGNLSGHDEWITSLDSLVLSPTTAFLASASQDNKIRIWKIILKENYSNLDQEILSLSENIAETHLDEDDDYVDFDDSEDNKKNSSAKTMDKDSIQDAEARLIFKGGNNEIYQVILESLLIGHEDWVTCVRWLPLSPIDGPLLFSASMDRNMVIWSTDLASGGVWTPTVRVGDIGGALGGSIGGNLLGFVDGCVSPDGGAIIGIGYGGSFHYWSRKDGGQIGEPSSPKRGMLIDSKWSPLPLLSGHFNTVNDIAWETSSGAYIVSVSSDETCRIFAPLEQDDKVWKEVSRPEIHGYSLNSIALLKGSYKILTAGEEKIIRAFDAPNIVIQGLRKLCGISLPYEASAKVDQAYIPELGLSNKGKDLMTSQELQDQEARGVTLLDWQRAPLESQLADYTLWLEVKKLYGHNNEVVCLATTKCGRFLASTSKARYSQACHILIWNLESFSLLCRIEGHESTVVALEFSPCGKYLASSGKDRSICIHSLAFDEASGKEFFQNSLCLKSAHKRIVWDCSWLQDSKFLITASRDGCCKIWSITVDATISNIECVHTFQPFSGIAVTAVEVWHERYCSEVEGKYESLVALGAENGQLELWTISIARDSGSVDMKLVLVVPPQYCHGQQVKRIRWKPSSADNNTADHIDWATCAEDNTVRVHRFHLER